MVTAFIFVMLLICRSQGSVSKINKSEIKSTLPRDCNKMYSFTCLKLDLVSWMDQVSEMQNYTIYPGVSIVRENSTRSSGDTSIFADLARSFPDDPHKRLDAYIFHKIESYLNTHSINVNLFSTTEDGVVGRQKSGGGGGLGGGKKGYGGALLMAGAMMKGTLMAMALAGLAALAGKALMTGLIALTLSALLGVKALSGGKGKTTYEIIAKPVHSQSHTHSTSHIDEHSGHVQAGWGRSYNIRLPAALHPKYRPA